MRFKCPNKWTIAQRIEHQSRRDPVSGCWLWQAAIHDPCRDRKKDTRTRMLSANMK